MLLRLPDSLHYPITITELLSRPDERVERRAPLFEYVYRTTIVEGDELGNEQRVQKSFPARFESSVEGTLIAWRIVKGTIIDHAGVDVVEIEEPCSHSIQFGGMCADCGKDMTETSYVTEQPDIKRATINMVHDNVSLKISAAEASRAEEESKRRLLASKKLILVVDLDQTIIHATVDPTVAEWQVDSKNPNHDAVKHVRSFSLKDDGPGSRDCWYYVKLRPGLQQFLEHISELYELHIYTMGTRSYAQNIAQIVDPDHRFFGDRILSRDESGSMTAKDLHRLFPVDTKMVVIIDDRADVWKWSPNLIKVSPYDFFVGIGDINSSFLPKRPDSVFPTNETFPSNQGNASTDATVQLPSSTAQASSPRASPHTNSESSDQIAELVDNDASPLDRIMAMGDTSTANAKQAETSSMEALNAQLEERPLAKKQKQLEADEEAAAAADTIHDNQINTASFDQVTGAADDEDKAASPGPLNPERPKHNLLQDHDTELVQLENSLRKVHQAFYEEYSQEVARQQGGRLGELRAGGSPQRKRAKLEVGHEALLSDLRLVPDIKLVMPAVKARVFQHCVIVFSGMIPLGEAYQNAEITILANTFGARIDAEVSKHTTHVVAARPRTQKVRTAIWKGKGRIKIVSPQWLHDSIQHWTKLDERAYLLDTDNEREHAPPSDDDFYSISELSEDDSGLISRQSNVSGDEAMQSALAGTGARRVRLTTKPKLPTEPDASSPPNIQESVVGTNEDWNAMNDELRDFLGSEDEDEDEGGGEDETKDVALTNIVDQASTPGINTVSSVLDRKHSPTRSVNTKGNSRSIVTSPLTQSSTTADDVEDLLTSNPASESKQARTAVENGSIGGQGSAQGQANGSHDRDGWDDFADRDIEAEIERAMTSA